MALRPQCSKCPWRDMEAMHADFPAMVSAAKQGSDGWVCHTRMGPCDGPKWAGVLQSAKD